jgi:hypothetical protein
MNEFNYNDGYSDCLNEMKNSNRYLKSQYSNANDDLKAEILKKCFKHLTIQQLLEIEMCYNLRNKY